MGANFNLSGLFTLAIATLAGPVGSALAAQRIPVASNTDPFGQASMLQGGGTAIVNDLSAADYNPAGLGLVREVLISAEAKWTEANVTAVEAGVRDSAMSEVAAGLKMRQSTKYSGAKDKRYTLGFAQGIADTSWVVGLAGDYRQIERTAAERQAGQRTYRETPRLRGGLIYALTSELILGARTDGWLDNIDKDKAHAIGIGVAFLNYYLANADLVFANTKPSKTAFGLTILAKDYLDLRVGYGYSLESKIQAGSAGVTVKSNQFRLYYVVSKPAFKESRIFHQIGAGLVVQM